MLLINKASALVVAMLNYSPEEQYLEEHGLLLVDAVGQLGDGWANDKVVTRKSQFWIFDKESGSFVFDKSTWTAAENKVLDAVVRALNMQFFPDSEKCSLVQLAASDYRKQIDDAVEELAIDYEKEILSLVR